jgi:BASS family bile acid:Na+ symporter
MMAFYMIKYIYMLKKWYETLAQSYIVIMVIALAIGLFIPQARHFIPFTTLMLQVIFFLSSLKMQPERVFDSAKDWKFLLAVNGYMMLLLPLVVFLVAWPLPQGLGLALFLLAAMPAGMTSPLLVEVAGGKQAVAMILVVTTSLLAPFTIPLMTKLLYGASIEIDAWNMFIKLILVIFIPFLLALLVRRLVPDLVKKCNRYTKPISLYLLGFLIIAVIANQAQSIFELSADWWKLIITIFGLYLFIVIMHLAGYFGFWWKPHEDKNTSSITLTYMNFVLAIYVAGNFFPRPDVLLPLVLIILPWATFLPVWQKFSTKLAGKQQKKRKKRK